MTGGAADPASVVRAYWQRVWNDADLTAPAELYAADAVMDGEPLDVAGFTDSVGRWFAVFPDFSTAVEELLVVGDRVASRVTYRGTHTATWAGLPATGRSFQAHGLDLLTVRDGRIVEHWHATDHYELVVQLGGRIAPADDAGG